MSTTAPRKFHIRSYNNHHTVYEILSRGERAVSPRCSSKEEASAALAKLTTSDIPRVMRG
jgi:hypothetical protein